MTQITLTIDYGYDLHSVEVNRDDWERVLSGESVSLAGQGFHVEGAREDDHWSFNSPKPGDLEVGGEDGRQIFVGSVADITVSE
jgi:hypothetical protein